MPPEHMTLEWFAESYQFTEDDTGSLSLDALEWWPLIKAARTKVSETRQAQQARIDQLTQESHANNGQPQMPFTQGMKSPGSG